jgi:hypothetical protein
MRLGSFITLYLPKLYASKPCLLVIGTGWQVAFAGELHLRQCVAVASS